MERSANCSSRRKWWSPWVNQSMSLIGIPLLPRGCCELTLPAEMTQEDVECFGWWIFQLEFHWCDSHLTLVLLSHTPFVHVAIPSDWSSSNYTRSVLPFQSKTFPALWSGCATKRCEQAPMHKLGEYIRIWVHHLFDLRNQEIGLGTWISKLPPLPLRHHWLDGSLLAQALHAPQFSVQRVPVSQLLNASKRARMLGPPSHLKPIQANVSVTTMHKETAHFSHQKAETSTAFLQCRQCKAKSSVTITEHQHCQSVRFVFHPCAKEEVKWDHTVACCLMRFKLVTILFCQVRHTKRTPCLIRFICCPTLFEGVY